jgi:hypothetical protein
MAFEFYINDQLTDAPMNGMTLSTSIKRDPNLGALLTTQDVKLEYNNNKVLPIGTVSGYAVLKALWDSGLCNEASITILDRWSDTTTIQHFTGTIKIADMEIDEQQVNCAVEIQDNSFYAYVNNNKSVKAALTSDRTKSKLPIEPVPFYDVNFFDSLTGAYGGGTVKMYRIYDVFKFLIPAITDNKVTFESTYLTSSDTELFLTRGQCLTNPTKEPEEDIELSFSELFDEIKKLPINSDTNEPIGFFIDATDPDNPVLRIENESYFFGSTQVYVFEDIKELKTYAKVDKLYSSVKVGSTGTIDGSAPEYTFIENTQFFGFIEENYVVFGQCNNDIELNLVNNFVISSNAINSAFMGGVTDFEGDLFIIECDSVNPIDFTADAKGYEFFGFSPPFYYNIGLNNAAKLSLYSNSMQSNIGNFLGIGSDGFRASLASDQTFTTNPNQPGGSTFVPPGTFTLPQPIFVDDVTGSNFDGNNNYNPATGEYIVPVAGTYSFGVNVRFTVQGLQSGIYCRIAVGSRHWDSTKTIIKGTGGGATHNSPTNGNFSLSSSLATLADVGDIVEAIITVRFYVPFGNFPPIPYYQAVTFQEISNFECTGTPGGSIVLAANTSENYRILQHEFKYNIKAADWQNIVLNPIGLFPFEKDGITRFGWIEDMKRDDQSGNVTIKLISSNATTP